MKLRIGFSTCPNDTYIFDALVHKKIDTEGLEFEIILADVEELNKRALNADLDITKLSYHAYAYLSDKYQILNSGSALGKNNGPLLIAAEDYSINDIEKLKIAIPGELTTANLLLKTAFPNAINTQEVLFSDIEDMVIKGDFDAGLIIHENRFTYAQRGLKKLIDLGEYWETEMQSAIPLGGIVINRNLPDNVKSAFQRVLKRSVQYAFDNPDEPAEYMRQYAQEMANEIMKKHVSLYVNNFTLSLGSEGKKAIDTLYKNAHKKGIIPQLPENIFLD